MTNTGDEIHNNQSGSTEGGGSVTNVGPHGRNKQQQDRHFHISLGDLGHLFKLLLFTALSIVCVTAAVYGVYSYRAYTQNRIFLRIDSDQISYAQAERFVADGVEKANEVMALIDELEWEETGSFRFAGAQSILRRSGFDLDPEHSYLEKFQFMLDEFFFAPTVLTLRSSEGGFAFTLAEEETVELAVFDEINAHAIADYIVRILHDKMVECRDILCASDIGIHSSSTERLQTIFGYVNTWEIYNPCENNTLFSCNNYNIPNIIAIEEEKNIHRLFAIILIFKSIYNDSNNSIEIGTFSPIMLDMVYEKFQLLKLNTDRYRYVFESLNELKEFLQHFYLLNLDISANFLLNFEQLQCARNNQRQGTFEKGRICFERIDDYPYWLNSLYRRIELSLFQNIGSNEELIYRINNFSNISSQPRDHTFIFSIADTALELRNLTEEERNILREIAYTNIEIAISMRKRRREDTCYFNIEKIIHVHREHGRQESEETVEILNICTEKILQDNRDSFSFIALAEYNYLLDNEIYEEYLKRAFDLENRIICIPNKGTIFDQMLNNNRDLLQSFIERMGKNGTNCVS